MKIVDRTAFLALPSGTVFLRYEPCVFEGFSIKADSLGNDFVSLDLGDPYYGSDQQHLLQEGGSVPVDLEMYGRDGLFEDKQLFAVYEKDDLEAVIKHLQEALASGYK